MTSDLAAPGVWWTIAHATLPLDDHAGCERLARSIYEAIAAEREAERFRCTKIIASLFTDARDTEFDLGFETARKVFAAAIMNPNR